MPLRVISCQVTAKPAAPPAIWCVPWFVAPPGRVGVDSGFKNY